MIHKPIVEFYTNKSVFVTGGTGFLGKVLIEKLLRSCPDLKNVYVLIRNKRNNEPESRVNEITNSEIFSKIKKESPDVLDKIIAVAGNMLEPMLGISEQDIDILISEVSVVFHTAANVKFNQELRNAFAFNVGGTREVLRICNRLKNLDALIHVSTAYSNCHRFVVEEKVYTPKTEIDTIEYLSKMFNDSYTKEILGKNHNTYTFTKSLAEFYLERNHGNLSVAILRPSIISSTLNDPIEGWISNRNGANGIVEAILSNSLFSVPGHGNCISDFIPVDQVANMMIVVAAKLEWSSSIPVYNCCTGTSNPITSDYFFKSTCKYGRKHLNTNNVYVQMTSNPYIHMMIIFFLQTVPAYLITFISKLFRKKSRIYDIQMIIQNNLKLIEFVTSNQWLFEDKNVRKLLDSMSVDEKKLFDIDVCNIKWDDYLDKYVVGIIRYLLKK